MSHTWKTLLAIGMAGTPLPRASMSEGNETIGDVGSSGSGQEIDDGRAKAGIAKVANLLK